MKTNFTMRFCSLFLAGFGLLLFACTKDEIAKPSATDTLNVVTERSSNFNFTAHLTGDQEVPPVETQAQGQAIVKISKDESSVSYKLIVANIDNVMASHFHMAPAGSNGGVVVGIYANPTQPSGPHNGILTEGVVTDTTIVPGLIDAIRDGNIYINVHTMQNGSGEIRGQL